MKIDTKYFGEIEIGNEKIVHFDNGILGFEDYKDYTILYDIDADSKSFFSWLQSIDEKMLAFPIVNPFKADENYNPHVNDEMLKPIGDYSDEDLAVFLMATIPFLVEAFIIRGALIFTDVSLTSTGIVAIRNTAKSSSEYEIKHKLIKQ